MTIKLEDLIPGGKANSMSLKDIAKHHVYGNKKDSLPKEKMLKMYSHLQKELKMGIKVEREHTDSESKAKEIAMDHLYENPDYYSKLDKAGLVDESKVGDLYIQIGETVEEMELSFTKLTNLFRNTGDQTFIPILNELKKSIIKLKNRLGELYDFGKNNG